MFVGGGVISYWEWSLKLGMGVSLNGHVLGFVPELSLGEEIQLQSYHSAKFPSLLLTAQFYLKCIFKIHIEKQPEDLHRCTRKITIFRDAEWKGQVSVHVCLFIRLAFCRHSLPHNCNPMRVYLGISFTEPSRT